MKGIRELSMSNEPEPAPTYSKPSSYGQQSKLFDYDYDEPKATQNYSHKSYAAPVKGTIEIALTVNADELGPVGDETSPSYDWNKAQNKAEEIAYDRLEELLGKGYDGKYSIEFAVYDDGMVYEITCTLTPNAPA